MTTNNHPANGPVSLERLHQIREHLQHDTQYSNGGNRAYILADVLKVIDGAIAAFSAEPVLYAAEETLAYAKMGELHLKCLSQPMGDAVIPLYTAPPAPVVPDEKPMPEASKMYAIDAVAAIAEVRGWNACRAAMLQAGNSPATPDGYVMVPVEPTAEMQSAAAGAILFNTTPINKLWTGNAVYRAMIAAAPQQGVKNV